MTEAERNPPLRDPRLAENIVSPVFASVAGTTYLNLLLACYASSPLIEAVRNG